jgi:hypothetical protein
MEAGDEGEQGVAAVADLLGLQGGEPAPLLLIEAAHHEVHLVVQLPVAVLVAGLAVGALTRMNRDVRHDGTSAAEGLKVQRSLQEKSWKSFVDAA